MLRIFKIREWTLAKYKRRSTSLGLIAEFILKFNIKQAKKIVKDDR